MAQCRGMGKIRKEQPVRVDVEGDKVTVRKGDDVVTAKKDSV